MVTDKSSDMMKIVSRVIILMILVVLCTLFVVSKIEAQTCGFAPDRPRNLLPVGGSEVSVTPTLSANEFSDADGDTLQKSKWQIRKADGAYGDAVCYTTTITGQTTSHDIPIAANLDYATRYYWHVQYQDNSSGNFWSGWSNETSFRTEAETNPPVAPTGLNATATSSCRIDLTWTDNSDDETGFKIWRKEGIGGTYSQIDTVGIDVTTYNDTAVKNPDTAYYYKVYVYNNEGDSTSFATDSAITPSNTYYQDSDGDTYGDPDNTTQDCTAPTGYKSNSTDCDDSDAEIKPGTVWYIDVDNDSYGSDSSGPMIQCPDPGVNWYYAADSHWSAGNISGDCDDSDSGIKPGAAEACNEIDDNCDGQTDENVVQFTYYRDADSDNYGDPNATTLDCSTPFGYMSDNTDCDDSDGNVNPGETEVCNGVDDNCDGSTDEGVAFTYYLDSDGDSYGNPGSSTQACSAPPDYVSDNTDCDDGNTDIKPGATEICDNQDNNCATGTDEGCDDDNDDYCDQTMTVQGTPSVCPNGGGDCNDSNAAINPGIGEICDDIDNNCINGADDGCDDDNDDYCDENMTVQGTPAVCPNGGGDCDDSDANVHPLTIWYVDTDIDGYGVDGVGTIRVLSVGMREKV